MQRKSFGNMQCPIARSLERVGEWWSILILRDAFYGLTRFDEVPEKPGDRPQHADPAPQRAGGRRLAGTSSLLRKATAP